VTGRPELRVVRGVAPAGRELRVVRGGTLGAPDVRTLPGGTPASGRPPHAAASRGSLATAIAAASAWLIEPADAPPEAELSAPRALRPVIAVFGLARGCGVTVVSRALAAELARRDVDGAAAVHSDALTTGIPLATQAAAQLARALADVPGADTRAVGRLCLVGGADHGALADSTRHLAPLVIDAGAASLGGVPAALADRVVLVATPAVEPALAPVAAGCIARLGQEPIVVLNRTASGEGRFGLERSHSHALPHSRMGAQLAIGGREPRGELGRAVAELADVCEDRR
jgi:hypothetical protein